MSTAPQSFANHAKYDPPFHFFLLPLAAIYIIVAVTQLVRHPGFASFWELVLALGFLVIIGRLRSYATHLQDRIIRLEERLRLSALLSQPLRSRIGELTERQLVGLRFASDAELPSLVQRTLEEKLSLKDIKKSITNWRADEFRV